MLDRGLVLTFPTATEDIPEGTELLDNYGWRSAEREEGLDVLIQVCACNRPKIVERRSGLVYFFLCVVVLFCFSGIFVFMSRCFGFGKWQPLLLDYVT